MTLLDIAILGPEGTDRDMLEGTVRRLGYDGFSVDPATLAGTPTNGDILMLDLRGEERGWQDLTAELVADERPLVIIADRPRRMVQTLAGRNAPTALLTGAEDDSGFRVALTLCSALCASRRPASPRRRRVGAWTGGTGVRTAPAV